MPRTPLFQPSYIFSPLILGDARLYIIPILKSSTEWKPVTGLLYRDPRRLLARNKQRYDYSDRVARRRSNRYIGLIGREIYRLIPLLNGFCSSVVVSLLYKRFCQELYYLSFFFFLFFLFSFIL